MLISGTYQCTKHHEPTTNSVHSALILWLEISQFQIKRQSWKVVQCLMQLSYQSASSECSSQSYVSMDSQRKGYLGQLHWDLSHTAATMWESWGKPNQDICHLQEVWPNPLGTCQLLLAQTHTSSVPQQSKYKQVLCCFNYKWWFWKHWLSTRYRHRCGGTLKAHQEDGRPRHKLAHSRISPQRPLTPSHKFLC